MAQNIFQRYGLKEVSNVCFEALADGRTGSAEEGIKKGDIVLYLDSLKVSTIEQTAENVEARGGEAPFCLRKSFLISGKS